MELQYADDNSLVALSEEDLQCTLDAFAKAYKQLGLAINVKKTIQEWKTWTTSPI